MTDLQILIQEVARIALDDEATTARIVHVLDLSDEELQRVAEHLNILLNDEGA